MGGRKTKGMEVRLPLDTCIRFFHDLSSVPDELLDGSGEPRVEQWGENAMAVSLFVDLRPIASLFHLHIGVYRVHRAYESGKVKSSLQAELCYQLGGNKNIPQSLRAFSLSPSTKSIAAIRMVFRNVSEPHPYLRPDSAREARRYDDLCNLLSSLGREVSPDAFPFPSAQSALDADVSKSFATLFKLSPAELASGERLNNAVITAVALKDC